MWNINKKADGENRPLIFVVDKLRDVCYGIHR